MQCLTQWNALRYWVYETHVHIMNVFSVVVVIRLASPGITWCEHTARIPTAVTGDCRSAAFDL